MVRRAWAGGAPTATCLPHPVRPVRRLPDVEPRTLTSRPMRGVDAVEVREMPQNAWTDKRERQYEHIKDSYEERGTSEDKAEEIAARTVNKERAEAGETKARKKDRSR